MRAFVFTEYDDEIRSIYLIPHSGLRLNDVVILLTRKQNTNSSRKVKPKLDNWHNC